MFRFIHSPREVAFILGLPTFYFAIADERSVLEYTT